MTEKTEKDGGVSDGMIIEYEFSCELIGKNAGDCPNAHLCISAGSVCPNLYMRAKIVRGD